MAPAADSWTTIAALAIAVLALGVLAMAVLLAVRPWPVEASLKSAAQSGAISLAGGLEVAGVSGSAAAILDGPGVAVVHWRARERWRKTIARVSPEALVAWLDSRLSKKESEPRGAFRRLTARAKEALLARTDLDALPSLGTWTLEGLRDKSVNGALTCGFSDPALTGKTAAWLFPVAGLLAPFGTFDVSLDWSGRTVMDGTLEVSFGVVPARVARDLLRFAWRHVHLRRKRGAVSSTLATSSTS